MKASVVIPVYNTGALLRRMLDSVLAQTERDLELICVDDGSTDGSDAVVEEYARRDGRVRLIRQKNQGPYVARTTGIMAARGDYVYICDHDDRLHPQLLEFCIYELEKNSMDIIVFGHEDRMEQGDFAMPKLPSFDEMEVKVLDDKVLKAAREYYLSALGNVHIDQWAHVAKRELAQSVTCKSDYNLPRTLDLIKRSGKWGWTPSKLYYYNVGNPGSLIKKAPTKKNILDLHTEIVGMIDLFRDERESGDRYGVWNTICKTYLIPNAKIMYNMIRRGKKALLDAGRLDESFRLFSIFLYDIFYRRGIPFKFVKLRHRMAYRWLMFKYRPDLDQSREGLTARILSNKSRFEAMTSKLASLDGDDEIIHGALEALGFQMGHSTGYYSSNAIEEALQKVARRHTVPLANEYRKDSVLHVMTQYLPVGGHTRVVERWIGRAPKNECHTVAVLTPPDFPPPKALIENIGLHGGEIVLFEEDSVVDKALKLRKLASTFDRVVLHVNCEDIIPILAFGTEEFKRPVLLFNHADHIFGLGVSIADTFIDMRTRGMDLSRRYRGVAEPSLMSLPYDDKAAEDIPDDSKVSARSSLGLPEDKKIVVSAASAYKYRPFLEWNFVDFMEEILSERDDVEFFIIGPKTIKGRFNYRNRAHVVGMVPPEKLLRYYKACDLAIDSFPFGSGLSLQDAISVGATVLSLDTIAGKMDHIEGSMVLMHSMDELAESTKRVLDDPCYAEALRLDVCRRLEESRSPERWLAAWRGICKNATCHKVRRFESVLRLPIDPTELFIESQQLHFKIKFSVPGIGSVVSYRDYGARKKHTFVFSPDLRYKRSLQ